MTPCVGGGGGGGMVRVGSLSCLSYLLSSGSDDLRRHFEHLIGPGSSSQTLGYFEIR